MTQRVLFVLNRVDDQSGGTLRAAVDLAQALVDAGARVCFAVPVDRRTVSRTLDAMADQVEVRKFPASILAARFGASVRHLWWLVGNVRRFECVHIHSAFYVAAVYTALICRIRHVPYFVWSHGSLDHYDVRKHSRSKSIVGPLLIRPMLNGAAAVLCTTDREARELHTFGAFPSRKVIPLPVAPLNTVDGAGESWRSTNGIQPTACVVLFFGRIAPKKGLVRLVEAMALLDDLDAVLVVAGSAANDDDIRAARSSAARLGLGERVRFCGWLEHDSRGAAFSAADVFVLPSDNENFAISVVEALLASVPVVISDQVYLSDELGPAGAAAVVHRDPVAIAAAIRAFHTDVEYARGTAEAGRQFAQARFEPRFVAQVVLAECRSTDSRGARVGRMFRVARRD